MIRTVKIRLYPSKDQVEKLELHFSASRYVYNYSLRLKKYAFEKCGLQISQFKMVKRLPKIKNRPTAKWIASAPAATLQQAVINMDRNYQNVFTRHKFPKSRAKMSGKQEATYVQGGIQIKKNRIKIPKTGWIKTRGWSLDLSGKIKKVSIVRNGDVYLALITVERPDAPPIAHTEKIDQITLRILDSGVIVDARDRMIRLPDFSMEEKRIEKYRKFLSQKKRYSKNWMKTRSKLLRSIEKLKRKRYDFFHKLSRDYADNFQTVRITDLKNLPEKVRKEWSLFYSLLDYKLAEKGGRLLSSGFSERSDCPGADRQ